MFAGAEGTVFDGEKASPAKGKPGNLLDVISPMVLDIPGPNVTSMVATPCICRMESQIFCQATHSRTVLPE